jgi:uncharacterized protein YndB with AHSA1/START domain
MKKLHFSVHIAAPRPRVWDLMLAPDTYRQWTEAFCEGSYYEGSWEKGAVIRFLSPGGEGMRAEIVEHRPLEHLSLLHRACITATGEQALPEAAYENYYLTDAAGGTQLRVEMDADEPHEALFAGMWPRALERLKSLCESHGGWP